jgi:nucleolar protein 15
LCVIAAATDDEVVVAKPKINKAATEAPAKKRKSAYFVSNLCDLLLMYHLATEEVPNKSVAEKVNPATKAPKSKPAKKAAAEPVVEKKVEVAAKKAKKELTAGAKKLKAMKDAPDAEAKALKEKKTKDPKDTKKSKKAEAEVTEPEAETDDDVEMEDQTDAFLKGFESENDESENEDKPVVREIPAIPELDKKEQKRLKKLNKKGPSSDGPGTIYLGRIPHGFYENEMKQYFKQFGDITNLRLSRNRQTGRSKHYAFVEFSSVEVAEIVAKTMDNYLLFGHILKCKTIPQEQIHAGLWEGANKRFKKVPWNKIEGRKLDLAKTEAEWEKKTEREKSRRVAKAEKLKQDFSYEFQAPELKSAKHVPKPAAPAVVEKVESESEKEIEAPKPNKRAKTAATPREEAKPAKAANVEAPKAVEAPAPKAAAPSKEKRKAAEEPVATEEPSKKKQKKLKSKASSDKLDVAAKAEKPIEKAAKAEKKVEKPVAEKAAKPASDKAKKAKKVKA